VHFSPAINIMTQNPRQGERLIVRSHLAALDALRGLAIILVVIGHYLPDVIHDAFSSMVLSSCALGGVTLFFLLSGFLIARNLERGSSTVGYAIRRIFRILPAYWASLVVLIVVHRQWLNEVDFGNPIDTLANIALLRDFLKVPLFNAAFWTLLIEAKFYMLAPPDAWRSSTDSIGTICNARGKWNNPRRAGRSQQFSHLFNDLLCRNEF
jgi:peptidoglycan/LPS O-acetylase OafA/YrhL